MPAEQCSHRQGYSWPAIAAAGNVVRAAQPFDSIAGVAVPAYSASPRTQFELAQSQLLSLESDLCHRLHDVCAATHT